MKKITAVILIAIMIFTLSACASKTLHCDNCNKEIKVSEKSNVEEDWILFCSECEKELFGEEGIVQRED